MISGQQWSTLPIHSGNQERPFASYALFKSIDRLLDWTSFQLQRKLMDHEMWSLFLFPFPAANTMVTVLILLRKELRVSWPFRMQHLEHTVFRRASNDMAEKIYFSKIWKCSGEQKIQSIIIDELNSKFHEVDWFISFFEKSVASEIQKK